MSEFRTWKDRRTYYRSCVVCKRPQWMRKNQKTCSGKIYGYACARRLAADSDDPIKRKEIVLKAGRASGKIARRKSLEKLAGLTVIQAYTLGYDKGYKMGYYTRKSDKKKGEYLGEE